MSFLKALGLTFLVASLLWAQIAYSHRDGIRNLPGSSWRFWDDMTLAIARYVDATSPGPAQETANDSLTELVANYRGLVEDKIDNLGVQPHQFWRTVTDKQFRNQRRAYSQPPNEDPGRSLLLLGGFRALGGVAPYLLIWVGVLAFLPSLLWINYELFSNSFAAAAVTLGGLISFSPYWFECLSLPHSALAFYLTALVALAAFALAVFGPGARPSPRVAHIVVRGLFLSAILVMAVWCRSGSVAFVPVAFGLAAVGFWKAGKTKGTAILLAAMVILVPTLVLRPHQVHNVWLPLWEGLGDFGADRGYSWYDKDAGKFLASQGLPLRYELRYVSAAEEAVFRKAFIEGVSSSPLWYAKVLVQRVVATLGLTHLSPYGPRDGESRRTPYFHYKYSTPVDWFGWKDVHKEVPVSALYLPTVALIIWGAVSRGRMQSEMSVLAAVGIAALPIPLLISTASGLETQAFSLVYFLGAAFLVQRLTDTLKNRLESA